ncbi:nitroreductase family protein [Mesorhizobium sp. DCY119]|uniref:nitroreductase family protein n=1 Tax=Mesorhizobium sp. DCY119 TaxID=2108445 RepID=UPI00140255B1|nr:nitroreductase family protein [Mesorhizobium sp. DCY119]
MSGPQTEFQYDRERTPQALLEERYRSADLPDTTAWNDTLAHLLEHRSIRAFFPEPVSESALQLAVAAAQSASNSQNIQPWSVVAVRDRHRIARLAKSSLGQTFVATAPLYLVWVLDLSRLATAMHASGHDSTVLHNLDPLVVGAIDTALAAQNAAIYFESLGLGVVYIGALRYTPEAVIEELGLRTHMLPLFGMCVGYPEPSFPNEIKPRLPQAVVLHREKYSEPPPALLEDYNHRLKAFRLENDLSMVDWTTYSAERFVRLQNRVAQNGLEQRLRDLGFGR